MLVSVARGASLFITEAYSFDRKVEGHLDVQTLVAHADDLLAQRIIVTHMGPSTLARLGDLPFEHAEDGMVVQV